jgi:hypothetical protein
LQHALALGFRPEMSFNKTSSKFENSITKIRIHHAKENNKKGRTKQYVMKAVGKNPKKLDPIDQRIPKNTACPKRGGIK